MRIKIAHISDWHQQLNRDVPDDVDLVVCTGDMLGNDPKIKARVIGEKKNLTISFEEFKRRFFEFDRSSISRFIDHSHETSYQQKILEQQSFPKRLDFPEHIPVVCVRGNHDFTSLIPLFGENTYEVNEPEDVIELTIKGKTIKVGGTRGVNEISPFREWSDEISPNELEKRSQRLPSDIDILISHCPPAGIHDQYGHSFGSIGLANYVARKDINLKAHCFGHIHEGKGTSRIDGKIFSNAATTLNVITIEV